MSQSIFYLFSFRHMKVSIRPRIINISLHILIWCIVLLLPYLVSTAASGYKIGLIPGAFFTITGFIHIAIFYGNAYYLYPKLFNRRYWGPYILAFVLVVLGSLILKYQILAAWFPDALKAPAVYRFIAIPSVGIFIISNIYRQIIDRGVAEKIQKERQAAQLLTELKFLRSQISPHFLFNVLTNLVSLARKKSDQLETSLIMLSDLMRYMLYDTQGKKVGLRKEIEYLNSYIELQKLRFGNDVQVDRNIEIDDEAQPYTIEPMLLIPFVENAFKHGIGFSEGSRIGIALSVDQGAMSFEVENKFDDEALTNKDESSGIGLNNVRARLDLLYIDNYTLTTDDRDHLFRIVLTLKLT
jgi:two-component system LytT family sensor kinase